MRETGEEYTDIKNRTILTTSSIQDADADEDDRDRDRDRDHDKDARTSTPGEKRTIGRRLVGVERV